MSISKQDHTSLPDPDKRFPVVKCSGSLRWASLRTKEPISFRPCAIKKIISEALNDWGNDHFEP
jgi:hypothetical protein